MNYKYQIFGSKDSTDYDILCFVKDIDKIHECHDVVKQCNTYFKTIYKDKPINCNLAVRKNGIVTKVFKGTPDEVNNSAYLTYSLHKQPGRRQITKLVERDVALKFRRVARFILTFFSRNPDLRKIIKSSLRSQDFITRLNTLHRIYFYDYVNFDFSKRKMTNTDVWKTISFQLAQTLLLSEGIEIYSKREVIKYFPALEVFINRGEYNRKDLLYLQTLLERYLSISIKNYLPTYE